MTARAAVTLPLHSTLHPSMSHHRSPTRHAARLCLALGLVCAAGAHASEADADITPYRPSVSNPAQLPTPGQLELELGGLHARASAGEHRSALPYLFKLAFDESWGVLLGGEAQVWQKDAGGRTQGVGDTVAVLKRAWKVDEATALGLEAGVKLPTAKDALGSGKADHSLNGIYSRDLGPLHIDVNLNVARLGRRDDPPGSSRTQLGASASFSTALSDRWGITGEWSGTHRKGDDNGSQVLAALTFSPSKRLTLDAGLARTVHLGPNTTNVFAGAVFPITRFW